MRKHQQRRDIMQLCLILLALHATFTESLKSPSGQFALLVHFTFYSSDCLKTQQINLMIRTLALLSIDKYVEGFDIDIQKIYLLFSIKNSGIVRYNQTIIKTNSMGCNRKFLVQLLSNLNSFHHMQQKIFRNALSP